MVHRFRQVAGKPRERGPRRCRRRRLVQSRYLPGISAHVPLRPCGLAAFATGPGSPPARWAVATRSRWSARRRRLTQDYYREDCVDAGTSGAGTEYSTRL